MNKYVKYIFFLAATAGSFSAAAQSTTSSPYSSFGLGTINGAYLPQNRALGGIAAGLRQPTSYFNINPANPASYSSLYLTSFDIGASGSLVNLARGNQDQDGFNASLSHITFGIPVNKRSALSFGLLPYSQLGYDFKEAGVIDTTDVNYLYHGEGGLSKAYLGYGFQIGKHISLGFNVSYLFGKLTKNRSAQFPSEPSALSSRIENSSSIGGLSYDYGFQYFTNISKKTRLTIGYSGSADSKINSTDYTLFTRYRVDENGNESVALDSLYSREGEKFKLTLPMMHSAGFVIEQYNKWLIGADFSYGKWSSYENQSDNTSLEDSYGIAVGAQITPDITAVSNYLKLIDYRLGFNYNKSYIRLNNTDVKEMAVTAGLGFPLPSTRSTFYKLNLGAEFGRRGTLDNNLIRERFVNLYIGFTLNDKWFQKYKFD